MLFPQKISSHYASKFKKNNCPLKKQVIFSDKESIVCKGFKEDPVGDKEAEIEPCILQKYKGRLLVLASSECAIHCRFCFRKNIKQKINKDLPQKLNAILKKDKSIKEVILSGGDPFMLPDKELKSILDCVPANIRIRIHSRIPIAMPKRFTKPLFNILKELSSRLVIVVHVNHPNELDKHSEIIFAKLAKAGATLLNQSVLLKGINDNAEILTNLSEKLFSQGVLPYYLHILDKAKGASHFEVNKHDIKAIYKELKENLSGFLVPRLVKEIKGEKAKVSVM